MPKHFVKWYYGNVQKCHITEQGQILDQANYQTECCENVELILLVGYPRVSCDLRAPSGLLLVPF